MQRGRRPGRYLEGRVLAGKDFIGQTWAWSLHTGLGVRHLSNGTTGTAGYRTDDYLYLPLGVTARTRIASQQCAQRQPGTRFLSFTAGNTTRGSALGGATFPRRRPRRLSRFDGFSDVSFSQSGGWAFRAGAKYQVTRRWSVEPFYIHWNVSASPPNDQTVTFTVNRVTAHERIGFFEPLNTTDEFGVKLGLHF